MRIVVDANETRSGLPELLRMVWDDVEVRRLAIGDVALGDQVVVERKAAQDFSASLSDGRLFRQARHMSGSVPRPVFVVEGVEPSGAAEVGAYRGAVLALAVGFRIPVLATRDLADSVALIRHMAAQESRRQARRRRREEWLCSSGEGLGAEPQDSPPETIEMLTAIPGVGPTRARLLGRRFGSIAELVAADVRALVQVPGIGPYTAARIIETLRNPAPITRSE